MAGGEVEVIKTREYFSMPCCERREISLALLREYYLKFSSGPKLVQDLTLRIVI